MVVENQFFRELHKVVIIFLSSNLENNSIMAPKQKPTTRKKPTANPVAKVVTKVVDTFKPKATREDLLSRLNDTGKYSLIKPEMVSKIPIQTQIAYVYKGRNRKSIPVISAFVQQHYTAEGGATGMVVKCGSRCYPNLYESMEKVYLYKRDLERVNKTVLHNEKFNKPVLSTAELEAKIRQLEISMSKIATHLTRSTSVTNLEKVEKVEKGKKPLKRTTSALIPKRKKSEKINF